MFLILEIKRPVARTVYNIASNSARNFIRKRPVEFRLGGPGVIVLVDTFPDINSNIGSHDYNSKSRLILCIAEIKVRNFVHFFTLVCYCGYTFFKEIPTRFYFHSLDRYSKTAADQIEHINVQALSIVQNVVWPGTVLVGNLNTVICSFGVLQHLRHNYPVIVSTQDLQKHDSPFPCLTKNLDVIWEPALKICEEAQFCKHGDVPLFLAQYLFCQRYGSQAFEMLLNQLSYQALQLR